MSQKWKSVLLRFIRALVAVILSGLAVKYGDNQYYILLAPVILAIDKALRGTQ